MPQQKYFPKINQWGLCCEPCMLKQDRTQIGSIACQSCGNYQNGSPKDGWLVCKEIYKATKNQHERF